MKKFTCAQLLIILTMTLSNLNLRAESGLLGPDSDRFVARELFEAAQKGLTGSALQRALDSSLPGAVFNRTSLPGSPHSESLTPAQEKAMLLQVRSRSGYSPLHYALKNGHLITFNELLNFGFDPDVTSTNAGNTLFHSAVAGGDLSTIDRVKELGLDLTPNRRGNTPIHSAAYFNQAAALAYLGRDYPEAVFETNNDQQTALHVAAARGNKKSLEALLEVLQSQSSDIEANDKKLKFIENVLFHKDKNGHTFYEAAIQSGNGKLVADFVAQQNLDFCDHSTTRKLYSSLGQIRSIILQNNRDNQSRLARLQSENQQIEAQHRSITQTRHELEQELASQQTASRSNRELAQQMNLVHDAILGNEQKCAFPSSPNSDAQPYQQTSEIRHGN